ncbi:MAG: hypothetical protein U0931_39395 [Vulcanimicrobiota bacterium]
MHFQIGPSDLDDSNAELLGWDESSSQQVVEAARNALGPHQRRWEQMAEQLSAGTLECPTCKIVHCDIRAYDRLPRLQKSIFICQRCGYSFGPDGPPRWAQTEPIK